VVSLEARIEVTGVLVLSPMMISVLELSELNLIHKTHLQLSLRANISNIAEIYHSMLQYT
jgi:hypothetical protein